MASLHSPLTTALVAGLAIGTSLPAVAHATQGQNFATQVSPATSGTCSPPTIGAPCARGGLTTQGNAEPQASMQLGNPVHLATGNKYQLDIDLPATRNAPGLELVRHYNARDTRSGSLGRNWRLSYDVQLTRNHDGWQIRQGDGSLIQATQIEDKGTTRVWIWPTGRRMEFDTEGRLRRIMQDTRVLLHIERHPREHMAAGHVKLAAVPGGHRLAFSYARLNHHVVLNHVDTPLGRFQYHYDQPSPESNHTAPRLTAVVRPDGMPRTPAMPSSSARSAGRLSEPRPFQSLNADRILLPSIHDVSS